MHNLSVNLCGIQLKNPLIAASGTFGFGREFGQFYDLSCLGGISTKGLTPALRQGNQPSRVAETASGMLNSVGLQNPGVDAFMQEDMPWLLAQDVVTIVNIAGSTIEDYCLMAQKLDKTGVHMLEMNISCPNVKQGGVAFGIQPEKVLEITRAVRAVTGKPLMVKLSPNVSDIVEIALAAQEGGADALSLINTLTGMMVDVHTKRPILANIIGGLSGPAVLPVALRMVYQVAQAVRVPVVGMGGIMTGEDAVAMLLCGARAVQVGTANLVNPLAMPQILAGIVAYMDRHRVTDVNDLVRALEV